MPHPPKIALKNLSLRTISFTTFLIFSLNSIQGYSASIQPPLFQTEPPKELRLSQAILPHELGTIEEVDQASSIGPAVILIQNAHAIADAQRNIQKIIEYFQRRYGIGLVAVEGASGTLDGQIFRSFPEKKLLQRVFSEYLQKGELSGTFAASIFNEAPAIYYSVS